MASPFDPYRVLGLSASASALEIKRAYRRLAKAYHPDSAGPGATPRFLAIQEAYDALTSDAGPGPGPVRPGRSGATQGPAGSSAGAGHGSRRTRPSPEPGPAPFGARRGRTAAGTQGTGGSDGAAGRSTGGWWQRRARRAPNRAILGSTTYDDAGEPEPEWEGASWYGQATGTYWTINPREYADPRKHGPEYQARAWRLGGATEDPADPDAGEEETSEVAAEE